MKELVGQGKPFYSAVDKAAGLLKRKVGTGAEFMQELKGLGGIKQSEIEDRGLGELMGAPKMTHEQFMAALAAKPAPAIQEKILDVGNTDDPRWLTREERNNPPENLTHHENYTLPGGKNYREMLIKMPEAKNYQEPIMEIEAMLRRVDPNDKFQKARLADTLAKLKSANAEQGEQFSGVGAHFGGEPGVLASMRLKDRMTPEGKKLLHLEELQSDWHQQGRDRGYKDSNPEAKAEQLKELKQTYDELNKRRWELHEQAKQEPDAGPRFDSLMEEANGITPKLLALNTQMNNLEHFARQQQNAVPNAPFKKNWEEMALKRLIHHAAENGYHGIVVTPGAEQADRYSLAKHIDDLHYSGTNLVAYDGEGNEVIKRTGVTPQELPSLVGKELAEKLMAQEPTGTLRSLRGVDMEVGGEGMKGFYDKKVPNILNSIGKKHGVKTQLHAIPLPKKGRERTDEEFVQALRNDNLVNANYFNLPDEVKDKYSYHPEHVGLHHFPITEEMRKDVLTNGLPLHREGGIIHKAVGGTVQPSINQMRAELAKKMPTSFADLSSIGANEAPSMNVKVYVPPSGGQLPVGGVSMGNQPLPIGGIDMNQGQGGQQLMPAGMAQPPQQGQPPQAGGMPPPLSAGASSPAQQPPSNILQMTPQGQALNAMTPPQQPARMAVGGSVPAPYKIGGSDNMPPPDDGWKPDNGVSTFNIDNVQQAAKGGSINHMKRELKAKGTPCMTHDHGYADGGRAGKKSSNEPKSTVKAYKLFRMHPKHPGKLFPLFVNANEPVEMNKWVEAQEGEMAGDKVKSKIGPLAYRPGWHAGDLPIATHIGEKSDPSLTAPDIRPHNHVWAEVEMPNDVDWQSVANERGMNPKGKLIERNAHITDQIPKGGHYRYKTNSNMTGNWLIGGAMKVNRILHDKEVKAINKAAKAKDLPRAQKQNLADYGFSEGGSTKKVKYTPPGMGREMNEPQLQRVAPMSKADIEKIALRMAPQIAGQYTPQSEKSQKQFAREQTLKHDIQPTASPLNPTQDVDLSQHMDKLMVGLPGDYTTTNQELRKVAGKKLKYPVVQQGGSRYGETHPNSIWASQEEAAQNLLNLAKAASRQYGDADVLANHIKMGPDSAYYAKHYVRAMLSAIESARLTPQQKDELTQMLREKEFGYGLFPHAPHFKNIKDIYANIDFDPDFRRHVGALMNRKYATDPYKIISGADMLHATSEPELRNLETGVTGHSIGELHFNKPLTTSTHSTYSHDIPGKFLGKLPVPVPYELSFPDAVSALRNSKNPEHKKALFGSLKMFGARQKIDQQLVDEIGQYRNMIKKLTGKKKGGAVKMSTNMDTINLELSRRTKKAK